MKAIIFNIKRFAVNDGPGIRTSIFFKGCPLKCLWCHNPESQSAQIQKTSKTYKISDRIFHEKEDIGYTISSEALLKEILKDEIFFNESKGGVSFSGGEPLMQAEFLIDILKKCKEKNIHTCIDTCGYVKTEKLKEVAAYTDLFLFDLKHLDDSLHKQYTGLGNTLILNNLSMLIDMNKDIILRLPLIEGINDSTEHLTQIKDLIKSFNQEIELNILPYHSLGKEKYKNLNMNNPLKEMPNMNRQKAERIRDFFIENNIKTIIA
jgi:pyruvate formate lyase activating enzyme